MGTVLRLALQNHTLQSTVRLLEEGTHVRISKGATQNIARPQHSYRYHPFGQVL